MSDIRSLSALLLDLKKTCDNKEIISISALLEAFHERGFGFFLFLFALPAALPIPAVGYGTLLAIPLLFLTLQQTIGRHTIWFPKKVKAKSLKTSMLLHTIDAALPWMKRIEVLVRPRLGFLTRGIFSNFIGLAGFIMACSILLPVPMTNTVPSFGIALMAIGVLMRDGLAVLGGAFIGVLWVSLLVGFTLYFGAEGLDILKNMIKSIL